MQKPRIFLYTGLVLLLISFIVKYLGTPAYCFITLFSAAIVLKAVFLVSIFQQKNFKPGLGLYFILVGVVMIFISLFFKYIVQISVLQKIFLYTAILIKATGLILLIKKYRTKKE
jgi:hypothetical protein